MAGQSIRIVYTIARLVGLNFRVKFETKKQINIILIVELFDRKKIHTTKMKISQHISKMNFTNYDHNKKFQSGYKKFYLNSPKGYSWKKLTPRLVFADIILI